jgi:hypothetical protein
LHSAFYYFPFIFVPVFLAQFHRRRFWIPVDGQQTTARCLRSPSPGYAYYIPHYVQLELLPYDFRELNGDSRTGLHLRTGAVSINQPSSKHSYGTFRGTDLNVGITGITNWCVGYLTTPFQLQKL